MDDLDRMFRRLVQNIRTGYPDYLSRPFDVSELYQNIIPYRHNRSELGLEQNQDYEFALMRLLAGERGYLVVDEALREEMQRELATPNPDTSAFRSFSTAQVSLSSEAVRRLDQYLAGGARPDDARLGRTAPRAPGAPPAPPPRAPASPSQPPAPPAAPPFVPSPHAASAAAPTLHLGGHGSGHEPSDAFAAPPPMPRRAAPERAAPEMPPARPAPAPRQAAGPSNVGGGMGAGMGGSGLEGHGGQGEAGGGHGAAAGGARAAQPSACRYCGGGLPLDREVTFCPHCGQNLSVRQCPACSSELEVGWRFCVTCGRGVEA